MIENPHQGNILAQSITAPAEPEVKITVSCERDTIKKVHPDDCATYANLRFSDEVPLELIRIIPPELI